MGSFITTLMTDEAASREIAKFVSCEKSVLGFVKDTITHLLLREEGPLLFVFPSTLPNVVRPLALKISRDAGALTTERAILNYLRSFESPSQQSLLSPLRSMPRCCHLSIPA